MMAEKHAPNTLRSSGGGEEKFLETGQSGTGREGDSHLAR